MYRARAGCIAAHFKNHVTVPSTCRMYFCPLKAGLHLRHKHEHKHKHKPRVNRDDASTSARKRNALRLFSALVLASSRFTHGLCLWLCLCLRRTCEPAFRNHVTVYRARANCRQYHYPLCRIRAGNTVAHLEFCSVCQGSDESIAAHLETISLAPNIPVIMPTMTFSPTDRVPCL